MFLLSFETAIMYSLISVFNANMVNPFNDWTETHAHQGFAWRTESVSFGLINDPIEAIVRVNVGGEIKPQSGAERAIVVPFTVVAPGKVEIAGLDRGEKVDLNIGTYALLFETAKIDEERAWINLTFVPSEQTDPRILIKDEALTPPNPLLMEARPATI